MRDVRPSEQGEYTIDFVGEIDDSALLPTGAALLFVGQPGYRPGLDRDGDGVACEK
ncbi:excalibur calcium-binding domain-containing protein [Kitasatospora sp. NPDC001540]|uniref:excalibur calcium-binding domain-containing protein n=1 Tax=Kitasatospora sp. NPDC001540 TaxID=3364014 RepID=UPI0036A918FF